MICCVFRSYYWKAICHCRLGLIESRSKTHGSARRAADEVWVQIQKAIGQPITMRRLSAKQYEVGVPAPVDTSKSAPDSKP